MRNPLVRDLLDKAITEIIEMGSKCVPAEKLTTVVSCSKSICKLLQVIEGTIFELRLTFHARRLPTTGQLAPISFYLHWFSL